MAPRRLRHPKLLPFFFPSCHQSHFALALVSLWSLVGPSPHGMKCRAVHMKCMGVRRCGVSFTRLPHSSSSLGRGCGSCRFRFSAPGLQADVIYFNVVSCCLLLTTPRSHLSVTDVGFALRSAGWLVRMGFAPSGPLFVANLKAIHSKM